MNRIVSLMRSRTYWLDIENAFFGQYAAGKIVDVSIDRSTDEVAVFMNGAGVNIVFTTIESGVLTAKFCRDRTHDTNDAAVTRSFNGDCFRNEYTTYSNGYGRQTSI
jgi:hypothetical protein